MGGLILPRGIFESEFLWHENGSTNEIEGHREYQSILARLSDGDRNLDAPRRTQI